MKKSELKEIIRKELELTEGLFMGPSKGKSKPKTVNVRHKTSGKELVIQDNPANIKKYKRLGYTMWVGSRGKYESVNDRQKILKYLVKKGSNKKDAEKLLDKHYDYVSKKYKDAPIAKKAEVIVSLHETQVTEGKLTADEMTLRYVEKLTDKNQHSEARTMAASLLKDHRLTNIYRAIGQIVELLGNAPPEVLKLRGRMDKMLKAGLQKQYENWEEIWKRL